MVEALNLLARITRQHALLLTCSCAALLLFNLFPAGALFPALTSSGPSLANENEIDAALQEAARNALGSREGSIIVMDAQSGRVRAAVNAEGAYEQAMMPGSSIKPFTTLAALRAGLIAEDSRTACPGRFTGLSFSLACVHANHLPPFKPSQAIAHSCNYYFATLGQRLGADNLTQTLRQFGFGKPTGLNRNEAAGMIRPCDVGDSARVRVEQAHASQRADCTAREALGESDYIQVTPVQLLAAYAALLNGGHLFEPQTATAENLRAFERAQINISAEERRVIVEGMAGAIRYGTARSARLDSLPLTIVGKTGTALPPKGFRFNGWFVGLAGAANNSGDLGATDVQLAVVVFLPRANGAMAAQVSRPIFEAFANHNHSENSRTQRTSRANSRTPDGKPSSSRPRMPVSNVRVHSVSENVTRELPLEDYVLGVMRAEGTLESEPEALKALAVAIRTYALKNMGRHSKDDYDFCSLTHCQRFTANSPAANERLLAEAIRATEGQVLTDDRGRPVDSYFGASCGGATADVAKLWGTPPASHLTGVRDEFCESGPHAHWTDVIARADLLRALQSDPRTDVGSRLDRITITKRDDTGRAQFMTLEGESRRGGIRGWDFKIIVGRVLGWNVLKSSRFEVARAGSNYVFRGRGFGHGLGLCQEGAHAMASRGASHQRILEKYFPGTSVGKHDQHAASNTSTEDSSWNANLLPASRVGAARKPAVSTAFVSPTRFVTVSSEHFRITYPSDVERRDVNQVLSILENARGVYLRRASSASIPISGLPFLEIRFNDSTGNFVGRTGQPPWAAAATKGNRIEAQPLAILKRRGVLNTTLKHELAHVLINLISRDRAPRWLEEGFAIYLAGEGEMFSRYVRRGQLTTDELEKRLQRPGTQSDMRALYAEAYLKVHEMIRNDGDASVWKRLAAS